MATEATGAQPLQLDITANSELFSLSVDLQPLRTAEQVAALQLALRLYPDGTPKRHEKIAGGLGREYTVEQVTGLMERLDSNSPAFLQLSSSLPQDGDTIYLIPPVDRCVACLEAPQLVVQRTQPLSPVVITEAGARDGVLHPKLCPSCGAKHSMSYAEGGFAIPAGKQLPYARATAPETRFVQLQKGYVFENSLLKGYESQALFSHTGYEPWAHEYQWKTGCTSPSVESLRKALSHTWLAWSLLQWLDELGTLPTAMGLSEKDALNSTLLEELRRDDGLHRQFVDKWGTRHQSVCRKPCEGESWCQCLIIDGHMKCRRQVSKEVSE